MREGRDGLRPRVLFIVNSLVGGGAEKVCLYMAKEFAATHDVDFVTLYDDEAEPDTYGINIQRLSIPRDGSKAVKLLRLLAARSKLAKFVRDRERERAYDLISSHLVASHILTALCGITDRCLIVHHWPPSAIEPLYPDIINRFLRGVYRRGHNVCVSEGVMKQAIERYGIDAGHITTIYNCIPLETVSTRSEEEIPFDKPFLLCVGRLSPEKRFDRMLDVYLQGGFKERCDLVFLGEGPLRAALEDEARDLGIASHVHFMGYVDNPFAWMRASKAMVMTSDFEALPTVLVEGLMAGARVISSDCDFGPREILTGELSRFLVEPDDIDGYVKAIDEAFCGYPTPRDDSLRRFEAKTVTRKYLERYEAAYGDARTCHA